MYPELSDKELFEEWKKGSDEAFKDFFNRKFSRLLHFASAYIRKDFNAEEAVMDLFFNIWKRRGEIEIPGEIDSYLYRALKNRIIDHYRRPASVIEPITDTTAGKIMVPACDNGILSQELESVYENAVSRLSPQRRLVFELSRKEGKSYAEIAGTLNLSVNTVENHISASLRIIRKSLRHADVILPFFIPLILNCSFIKF